MKKVYHENYNKKAGGALLISGNIELKKEY